VVFAAKYRGVWSIIRETTKCLMNNWAVWYFINHGSHMDYRGIDSGLPHQGSATNLLSTGTTFFILGM
jgi:hypothetical protein